jgi:hypothetical protein
MGIKKHAAGRLRSQADHASARLAPRWFTEGTARASSKAHGHYPLLQTSASLHRGTLKSEQNCSVRAAEHIVSQHSSPALERLVCHSITYCHLGKARALTLTLSGAQAPWRAGPTKYHAYLHADEARCSHGHQSTLGSGTTPQCAPSDHAAVAPTSGVSCFKIGTFRPSPCSKISGSYTKARHIDLMGGTKQKHRF